MRRVIITYYCFVNRNRTDFLVEFVGASIYDNEVAPLHERKQWEKKWKRPKQKFFASEEPPTWSDFYISEGVLHLPYAEIDEPFYAWVDIPGGKSRIDFYGGFIIKCFTTKFSILIISNNFVDRYDENLSIGK